MSSPTNKRLNGENDQAENESTLAELRSEVAKLRKALAESERGRIEYLQNVAHQLVAPLNAIKWHIENITNRRVSVERARKVLRSIYSQATIAVHLAKNFALMSNLEADHSLEAMREPLEPVKLEQMLVNLADDFQPQGWDREIRISVSPSDNSNVPDVLVIRPLISQVFSNIIENAVKYSNNGTTITIACRYHEPQDIVVVSIGNQGIGIPDAETESIFDRGYRSEAARNKYPVGTGFGLFIAKHIVELHEGDIDVSSDGRRTVFEVALPVRLLEGKAKQWPKKRPSY